MNKHVKKIAASIALSAVLLGMMGCAGRPTVNKPKKENEVAQFNEVKYKYSDGAKDYDVTVKSARKKAVTLSQFMTEMLLALDLGDNMVGTALLDNPVLPEYEEAYKKIPVLKIAEGHAISKESFMALNPDFVSGWDSSISDSTTGTPDELISKDIAPFMAKSYEPTATVETVYEDFTLLGKIFGVEDKADEVVSKMKKDIKEVTDKVGDIKDADRAKLMVYDSGENDAMVVGSGLANNLITLAGASNVYGKNADKPYINVSWESVVKENPDIILVTDYMAGSPVDEKINFLKSHPALKNVNAIKNNKIYVVGLADLSPGVRNPKLIKQINGYINGDK